MDLAADHSYSRHLPALGRISSFNKLNLDQSF
jgi:hypothetical protein